MSTGYGLLKKGTEEGSSDEEGSPSQTQHENDDNDSVVSELDLHLKGPDPNNICPPCCNLRCCCHGCYIFFFVAYLVIFPLWCKWLLTAPMPSTYWGQEFADFPRMSLKKAAIAATFQATPQIILSDLPDSDFGCNSSCGKELRGFTSGEINFNVDLRLNKPDLDEYIHTTYPVIFTSQDFKEWMLAADRRNANPTWFADSTDEAGREYVAVQDACSKPALTQNQQYLMACVMWNQEKFEALEATDDPITGADLGYYCDALGGVCGYVGGDIPSSNLPNCSAGGQVSLKAVDKLMGAYQQYGNVTIRACDDPLAKSCSDSATSLTNWKTHQCEIHAVERRLQLDLPPGMADIPSLSPTPSAGIVSADSDEEDESGSRYTSLPRLQVMYTNVTWPTGSDIYSKPKVYIFSSKSLDGEWDKIYAKVDPTSEKLPATPVGGIKMDEVLRVAESDSRTMDLIRTNMVSITPSSCFGKRGPLYVVACAINQSSYDDAGAWKHNKESRFEMGQRVMPPPFNDRCVAVAGRCGNACGNEPVDMQHCDANGYIPQEDLVGKIPIQYNRVTPVFMFAYVLLFGFAVKVVMLCPGIFSPYPRCQTYSSDLTEQLKYILVVGVTGGGDEGRGTMLRNTIGMVSGLPPDCKCHFVVCNNEEGHRLEMLTCWEKFCNVIACIPQSGSYEQNLRSFMRIWCDETKTMRLRQVGGNIKTLDPTIQARLSGKTTLDKAKKMYDWQNLFGTSLTKLQNAIDVLHEEIGGPGYNKFSPMTPHHDYVRDWVPPNPHQTALRMHFTSRAKPTEDSRNIMVQHVAPGTWYYKVKVDEHHPTQWLELRRKCVEMVYSQADPDRDGERKVPLRSSHGKAGGLNFVDNYISIVYNHRSENQYPLPEEEGDFDQNEAPSLYAIADARHQFQPDFFISCVPCFFKPNGSLNTRVAFTQAPQHYPEYADKRDYLDNNNAQFFRLNAMIRNCCGGVSSCGTNGMWQLHADRPTNTIWQERRKRVRDRDDYIRTELIEREQFHTSCKIEDTASSLDRVLVGEYSHFVNRKLSFGMSKDPEGFLGAQQRWVEGAITLCLQWVTNNADAHGTAARNQPLLWAVIFAFIGFLASLMRLVTKQYTSSVFVELGFMTDETFDKQIASPLKPGIHWLYNVLLDIRGGSSSNTYSYEVYENMTLQFIVFLCTCMVAFFGLWLFTNFCRIRCLRRRLLMPFEMKWWGRLLISFDNLTYWIWFWTSFFWIGFNVYLAIFPARFHFHNLGMMSFMLVATFLNYALIISNSLRFQVMESIDANEIAFLSMDNIWRANQLFFMVGPIQGFSVFTGVKNFINYLFYGQDIGGWSGGDLTQVSIAIVKWWTSMIICGCIAAWIYLYIDDPPADEYQSRRPGCIIFTFIALDVMHPCIYLWTVGNNLSSEEAGKMSCLAKATSAKWWKKILADIVLNESVTDVLRYIAPVYNFMLPILVFFNAYFGVSGGFTLVAVGAGH
mmetsp:Transcript_56249/g.119742  ORF Transcript_56249/g.119742 Transcript_56249/m.119742 type:complete len:1476 (+) Transcript_56249:80-4507(+)